MQLIDRKTPLWVYLTDDLKGLLYDGELLANHAQDIPKRVSDYSYLVFPFAKAYEGFLKRLFLDMKFLQEDEYYGEDIRIGRILNPTYIHEHTNVCKRLSSANASGVEFVTELWRVWKIGRNQVFHYFPHNFRKLSYDEAIEIINDILEVMSKAVRICYIKKD